MAFRDLTPQYFKLRAIYVKPQFGVSSPTREDRSSYDGDDYDDDDDLDYTSSSLRGSRNTDLELATPVTGSSSGSAGSSDYMLRFVSPHAKWINVLHSVRDDIKLIEQKGTSLRRLHTEHLTPRFGKDFSAEERDIEIETEDIKRLFQDCKSSIDTIPVDMDNVTSQEELMLKNLKLALVTELSNCSKTFRTDQKDYLQKMKMFKERQTALRPMQDQDELDPEERQRIAELEQRMYDPGFTEDQVRDMIENEQDIIRRDKEIRDILRSIIELQELFREFSTMVIEQGTMLDRIDYNIQQTETFVQKANKNLVVAEKYQKVSRMTLVIILLVIAVVAAVVFFAAKIALNFNGLSIL